MLSENTIHVTSAPDGAAPDGAEPAEVALDVVRRMADPERMAAAIAAAARQTTFTDFVRWRPHSVAGGFTGTAIVFGAADGYRPGEGWDRVGHRHLADAVSAIERVPHVDTSLYAGLSGIGFAAQVLAGPRARYRRLLQGVDAELLPQIEEAAARLDQQDGGPVSAFDLISGLAGAGVYLLSRRDDRAAGATLRLLLGALVRLLADRGSPRRWHTRPAWLSPAMRASQPQGNLNCGLAHGLPGPLALLALAHQAGVVVDGHADALHTAAQWLVAARVERPEGPDWPNAVGLADAAALDRDGCAACVGGFAGRVAWCYGSPGVARSLWLAGTALADPQLCDLAVRTMTTALARPPDRRLITSPTFCHGTAGLLQIAACFARDTGRPELVAGTAGLAAELVARYEPGSVLGYRDIEPGDIAVDQPSLLDGAPGVALALLGAGGVLGGVPGAGGSGGVAPGAAAPAWERLFLLS